MTTPTPPERVTAPIRSVYLSAVIVTVVVFVLFAAHTWREVRTGLLTELDYVNRLFQQTTESVFLHQTAMLRMLGQRLDEVEAINLPDRGKGLVDQVLMSSDALATIRLYGPDGRALWIADGTDDPVRDPLDGVGSGLGSPVTGARNSVGPTYQAIPSGRWRIPMTHVVKGSDGDIRYILSGSIDIGSDAAMWNAIELKAGMRLMLVRDDGFVQLVLPAVARPHSENHARMAYGRLDTATADSSSNHGGLMRVARVKGFPHTVISRYDKETFTEVYLQRMMIPSVLLVMAMLVGALIYRFMRHSQRVYEKERLHHATHDALTSLPNRLLLEDRIRQDIARARRRGRSVAIMYVDLDQFKRVNDSLGHNFGDQLLCACGRRLELVLRDGDTIGRMGGDEFLLIFPDLVDAGDARQLAARVLNVFSKPFDISGHEIFSNASVGVALFPDDGNDSGTLLKNADAALFRAKDEGRDNFVFFEPTLNEQASRRIQIEHALRSAVARNELRVVYQPKANAHTLRWEGAEALLRWHHPKFGEVSPLEFIPVAEETGMIETLGWFVLHNALRDIHWVRAIVHDFEMSINVSLRQFRNPDFIPRLLERLRDSGVPPGLIELEVTESIMAESGAQFEVLRGAGLRLAIDDFGTGFSCLSYLKRLPVTTLKLDREFVRDLEIDGADKALITAMIAVARELDLSTVAEGVENRGQMNFLQAQGCDQLQGYLLGRPMPIEGFLQQLKAQQTHVSTGRGERPA